MATHVKLRQFIRRHSHFVLSLGIFWGAQIFAPSFGVAADLEEIRDRGYLIVAVKDNWEPLGFRDDETGELVGLEIDIARQLAASLLGDANAVEFKPVRNTERLNVVIDQDVDIAIAVVTASDTRRRIVDFSVPYYLDGTAFITQNPAIQSFATLRQHPIAVLERSSTIARVRSQMPTATLVGVSSYQEAKDFLDANPMASFAGDASVLGGWVSTYPDYQLVPVPLLEADPLAVVVPKGLDYDPLRRTINTVLQDLHDSGWIDERLRYWNLP